MKGIYVETLAIVVTEKCNLNCAHCLRGKKQNRSISSEVISAIFDQVKAIDLLNICGGEPTLAIDEIEEIFKTIIRRRIFLRDIYITINGTIFDDRFYELCEMMESYIQGIDPTGHVKIGISCDKYHLAEMKKKNIHYREENFESKFFSNLRELNDDLKLFREGNANELDERSTVPLRPMKNTIIETKKSKYTTHQVGPLITINMDGTITEDNAPYDRQQSVYNYGNVLKDNIVTALLDNGARKTSSKFIYKLATTYEKRKYLTYKK